MQVRVNRTPGRYDEFNQPHLNIHEAAAKNEKYTGGRFVRDDKSEMLVIYGHEKNMPPLDPDRQGTLPRRERGVLAGVLREDSLLVRGTAAVHRQ